MPGNLFIVAAPSGAGKSSLVNALLKREPGIKLSVSYTSRGPRPGEIDGVHYHFVTKEKFLGMVDQGDFLEHALVHGDLKGTAKSAVEGRLAAGEDVLLEIDYQGARIVRALLPKTISIFILPPSREELELRLRRRAQDSEEVIRRRMKGSHEEMAHAHEFDYIVINDRFDTALEQLVTIVHASRLRRDSQLLRHESLLRQLLGHP